MTRWWAGLLKAILARQGLIATRFGRLVVLSRRGEPSGPNSSSVADWLSQSSLVEIVRQEGIDLVIDVGANDGQFALMLRHHGFTGTILSFEPQPACIERLREMSKKDDAWQAFEIALGDRDSVATLNVNASSEFSSFSKASREGTELFPNDLQLSQTINVPMRRLDGLITEIQSLREASAILLKIDTQGHDAKVLDGARGVLDRCRAIFRELSIVPIYGGIELIEESLIQLRSLGFLPVGFYSVSRNAKKVLIEVDGLFVRSTLNHPGAIENI